MLSLKVEGQGHIDLQPNSIIAFEEVNEGVLEDRPKAKCGVFFDIGEGLNSMIVENNYEILKKACPTNDKIELNVVSGGNNRRMTIPRDSIVYRADLVYDDEQKESAEFELPNTIVKISLAGQIVSMTTRESRDEISVL